MSGLNGMKMFRGGVHPPDQKQRTAHLPAQEIPLPERIWLPVSQHIGAPARPVVAKGDVVLRGQVVAEPAGFVSAPIHASTSGKVRAVGPHAHPMGVEQVAIEIEVDGDDTWAEPMEPLSKPFGGDPAEIRSRIAEAGIVGMGGATFPTHVKLSPPPEVTIDSIILNGVECEPFLTADHRLMLERPDDILSGLKTILAVFGLEKGYVGIEENKPDAIALMQQKAKADAGSVDIEVKPLPVQYPQGAEKQLIHAILGRDVPSGALPMAVGAVVQNVATAVAVWEAVSLGRPLTERLCTITGDGVVEPKNLVIRPGTPLSHIVQQCGGLTEDVAKVVMGGPMMGMAQCTLEVPATKGTSGVLCLPIGQVRTEPQSHCISCGRCIGGCPMGLSPTTIYNLIDKEKVAEADDWNTLDCIECGSCSYVCPARIPLVQYIRYAKGRVLGRRQALKAQGG